MKNKKKMMNVFLGVILFLFLTSSIFALGARPAKKDYNFQPGMEISITYKVFGSSTNKPLIIAARGELAKYVKLDKNRLTGDGEFTAMIELPNEIETPGKNSIYISIAEQIDEELAGTFIGTSVAINPLINIYVPYPGKYLDVVVEAHDVNVGEPVKFDLDVISRGSEDVVMSPRIEIVSQNKTIETLFLNERDLVSQEKIKLKKFLITENYNPGTYEALAVVSYAGKSALAETSFRIGDLTINLLNYTKQLIIDNPTRFILEVESGWNDNLNGVYADIDLIQNKRVLTSFKTTSTDLTAWEKDTLVGYFDASNLTEGIYDANVSITYYGKDVRKSSSELIKLELIKKSFNLMLVTYILIGLIVLITIILLIWKFVLKKRK